MHFIPPLVLCDGAFFQLSGNRGKHFTRVIGKVKVSHLSRGDGYNGKSLFVLFECRCTDLEAEKKCTTLSSILEIRVISEHLDLAFGSLISFPKYIMYNDIYNSI